MVYENLADAQQIYTSGDSMQQPSDKWNNSRHGSTHSLYIQVLGPVTLGGSTHPSSGCAERESDWSVDGET